MTSIPAGPRGSTRVGCPRSGSIKTVAGTLPEVSRGRRGFLARHRREDRLRRHRRGARAEIRDEGLGHHDHHDHPRLLNEYAARMVGVNGWIDAFEDDVELVVEGASTPAGR